LEISTPWQAAGRYSIAECSNLLFWLIFPIVHAVANPVLHIAKTNFTVYVLELKQKEVSNPFKFCNKCLHVPVTLHETIL
jgi:hypothetical protein